MKCVSWGKGDGSVAGAADVRASLLQRRDAVSPLQGRTVLVRPQAKRALSFSGFALSCPTPVQVPSHRSLLGLYLPGSSPSSWRQQRHGDSRCHSSVGQILIVYLDRASCDHRARGVSARVNAVLQPASQAPRLRRLLAGARHSIGDRTIALACSMRSPNIKLMNGSRLRCSALSNHDAVGGEASFPRASIALSAAGWISTICRPLLTTRHHVQ